MSANLIVDLFNTAQVASSIADSPFLSGGSVFVGSGAAVGQGIYLGNADTACNVYVAGVTASGQLRVAVQTSLTDVSGNYTDPTSGIPTGSLPGAFQSGGILWINSGGVNGGLLGTFTSGYSAYSGFITGSYFQRPQQGLYARLIALAEGTAQFAGSLNAGFITQNRTTGSGGGYSYAPTSGSVNV